jgi:hypothetical protein
VDDVLAPDLHDDRLVRRQVELIDRRDVIFRLWIGPIESQRVVLQVDELDVRLTKSTVGSRIADVPCELFGGDMDHQRLALRGYAIDPRGPERNGESEQQNQFHHEHADLEVARRVRLDAGVDGDRLS